MFHGHQIKIILVGNSGVGKTSIMNRICGKNFSYTVSQTVGVDFTVISKYVNGKLFKIQLWDTSGHERFMSLTKSYYRGCHGAIFVFDLTNAESFDKLKTWIEECGLNSQDNLQIIIVGNKIDLKDKIEVSQEKINELCKTYECGYIETSAKDNINLNELLSSVALCIVNTHKELSESENKHAFSPSQSQKIEIIGDLKIASSSSSTSSHYSNCSC